MRLFELAGPDPLTVRLISVISQLKGDMETGEAKTDWTADELLAHLADNDISLDKNDLYDMIKNPPLNKFISNIQGDQVIFKGQESDTGSPDQQQDQRVVQQMAHDAMK
jgi:hypothetical protein